MTDNLRNKNGESYEIMRFNVWNQRSAKKKTKKNSEILLNILYVIKKNLLTTLYN